MLQDFDIAPAPAAPMGGGLDQLDIAPMGGPAAPAPAPAPPELLGVLEGAPPAVKVPSPEQAPGDPIAEYAASHFEDLIAVGIDFYDALDGGTVFFNPQLIDEAALLQADQAGQLDSVAVTVGGAPPIDTTAPAPAPAAPTGGGGLPAAASGQMTGARLSNGGAMAPAPTNPLHGLGARAL